jgi:hypothetical protein
METGQCNPYRVWAADWAFRKHISIPGRVKRFFSKASRPAVVPIQSPLQLGGGSFPGCAAAGAYDHVIPLLRTTWDCTWFSHIPHDVHGDKFGSTYALLYGKLTLFYYGYRRGWRRPTAVLLQTDKRGVFYVGLEDEALCYDPFKF